MQTQTSSSRLSRVQWSLLATIVLVLLLACSAIVCSAVAWAVVSGRVPAEATRRASVHVVDVAPKGWRRTVDGWERAESWFVPAGHPSYSIQQWLAMEEARQSSIVRASLQHLRQIHPLTFSLGLLITVLGIAIVTERRADSRRPLPTAVDSSRDRQHADRNTRLA
ncbi:MAG: hypothetical protein ACO1RT_18180 [Planctomycetaceae bacterium]